MIINIIITIILIILMILIMTILIMIILLLTQVLITMIVVIRQMSEDLPVLPMNSVRRHEAAGNTAKAARKSEK